MKANFQLLMDGSIFGILL